MSGLKVRSVAFIAAITMMASVSGAAVAQGLPAQTSNQSAVGVKVTPRNLQGDVWEFDVVFDTHSQELKDDLTKDAVLVAADGTKLAPAAWQGDPPGGHHRKGVLRFNSPKPAPSTVVLLINRSGEAAPRSFKWTLK